MKKFYTLKYSTLIIVMLFSFTISSQANTPNTLNTQFSEYSKSDSLPSGVTKDWLKGLRDENGNRIIPEDETDALQQKTFNGFATGDQYGYSVASAGDVNGDGYDDVIIGAPFSDGAISNEGRAYIYFGGVNMNTIPDVTFTGENYDNYLGSSVSGAGDINGDGYDDVIVGATGYISSTGRAYIYYGGNAMNNVSDVVLTGENANDFFGISVSQAGDVNGDGYSDVIVGAYFNNSFQGKAYLYLGGVSMNNFVDVTFTGEAANNYFGISVSGAGDVNGDGFSDVIVGAFGNNSNTGKAYIFEGGVIMNNSADVIMTGESVNSKFGYSVSDAGDVNGDGFSDVIAGAIGNNSTTGRAYIFAGGAAMDNIAEVILSGETANSLFGSSVSGAGDVNGDGYSDVIVGAPSGNSTTGSSYVFYGAAAMNNVSDMTLAGESSNNNFGCSVSEAGDVNGDGYSDFIAGAYGYNSSTGRAYVYSNKMSGEDIPDLFANGEAGSNYFGYSVSDAGDVNGDGYSDVIVGAYGYASNKGRAYIFYGGENMNNIADVTLTGEVPGNLFGRSVSGAGDVNGDGYSDVIVGADEYINLKGRAYIYYGGAAMNSVADVIMTGEDFSILFGFSVSGAGDVNGDGYSDVIVGAPEFGASAGRAYIFYGSSVMNNIADVVMDGEAANNYFGSSVSEAGDINGDGYSDVVIGAYGFTTNKGKVYIYYGGSVMNNFPDVNMTGENINDKFGVSVSSAGDVNNDGYSDVIVGAEGFDISTGRAYIYYGGNIVNNVADVVMTGESIYFGHSVSDAGDVNGDGYDDIIISAYGYSSYLGKAYIFFGGTSMNNNADITMTGEGENNYFGYSVSGAGDLNGDGYSDLIAGAYQINSYTGKVYFYFSSPQSVKPILNYVKDIPNDQGGKVKLKWSRSGYDVAGNNTITDYYIESSEPPIGNNFTWLPVGTVSATKNPFYAFNVTTLFDSSANAFGLFYYRITARTSNPSEFWRSNILYGRSIDNIAPFIVSPFTAVPVSNNVRLNWGRSSAPDFLNYVLYRSISSMIDPETATVFATTSDSTYLDTSPLSGLYYYFIVAQDIHNNKSPVAVAVSPNITLNLTIFIEGFYNAGNNSQVSDTIKASLRNTVSPYAITDESIDVVSSNGSSVFKFGNASDGTYYISINHRNSIETWSATGTILSRTNPASYNFSSSLQQAFGNNLKQVDHSPIRFAIYSGDVNQDGTVDLSDLTLIDNDAGAFTSGYVNTDLTGDDFVDVADLALGDNNAANFVSVVKP